MESSAGVRARWTLGPAGGGGAGAAGEEALRQLKEDRRPDRPLPRTAYRRDGVRARAEAERRDSRTKLRRAEAGGAVVDAEKEELLLLDGYNLCGSWEPARSLFLAGSLEAARSALLLELDYFFGGRAVVVFDAGMKAKGEEEVRGQELPAELVAALTDRGGVGARGRGRGRGRDAGLGGGSGSSGGGGNALSIVFAHDADEFIDRAVAGLFRGGGGGGLPPPVTVVTSDGLSTGVCRGYGASVVASEAFMERVGRCRSQLEGLMEEAAREAREGARLVHALGADEQAHVRDLRGSLHAREVRKARSERAALRRQEESAAAEARAERGGGKRARAGGKERKARFDDAKFSSLVGGGGASGLLALRDALGGDEEDEEDEEVEEGEGGERPSNG